MAICESRESTKESEWLVGAAMRAIAVIAYS